MEKEVVGDPGSSCKYNLFISDSGWRIIKDALSQRECDSFSELCLLWKVNTHSGDIYCLPRVLEIRLSMLRFVWEHAVQRGVWTTWVAAGLSRDVTEHPSRKASIQDYFLPHNTHKKTFLVFRLLILFHCLLPPSRVSIVVSFNITTKRT